MYGEQRQPFLHPTGWSTVDDIYLRADSFQRGISGLGPAHASAQQARDHSVRHVRQFLRPELFNRIDRIVPFAPLEQDAINQIAGPSWLRSVAATGSFTAG